MVLSLSSQTATASFTGAVQSPAKAGFVQPFAGATPPIGWALCNGAVMSQTTYPDLFTQIGTTWDLAAKQDGTGGNYTSPGAGNFRLPDLRGVFLRGVGTSSKADGNGDITVTLAGFSNDSTAVNALATSSSTVTGTITHNTSAVTGTITMNSSSVTGTTNIGHTHGSSSISGSVDRVLANTPSTAFQDWINNNSINVGNVGLIWNSMPTTPGISGTAAGQTLGTTNVSLASGSAAGQTVNTLSLTAAAQTVNTMSLTAAAQNLTGSTETAPRYTGINYLIKLYNDSASLAVSTGQMIIDGNNTFSQLSASPAAPQTGYLALYAKNDGIFYQKTPAGVETPIAGAAAGDVTNGGNTFGSAMTIGTNDSFALNFETAGATIATGSTAGDWSFGTSSGAVANTHLLQGGSDSTVNVKANGTTGAAAVLKLSAGSTSGEGQVSFYNGITLRSMLATDNANTYGLGANSLVFRMGSGGTFSGGVSSLGAWTLGNYSSGSGLTHKVQSNGATTFRVNSQVGAANAVIDLSIDNTAGTKLIYNGSTNYTEFYYSSTLTGQYTNLGAWTFGTNTLTGFHSVKGSGMNFTTASAADTFTHNYTVGSLQAQTGVNGSAGKIISTGTTGAYSIAVGTSIEFGDLANNIRGRMTAAGNWANTAGTWSTLSDSRLKENVAGLTGSLAKINALNPVTYTWIDQSNASRPTTGFIAQELETVMPNLVSTYEDSGLSDAKNVSVGGPEMIAHLVKAIQELTARLEALENA